MPMVHDPDGSELANMPLSENQIAALKAGTTISVLFHTPLKLQAQLGNSNGSFGLRLRDDKIETLNRAAFDRYVALQAKIATAQEA